MVPRGNMNTWKHTAYQTCDAWRAHSMWMARCPRYSLLAQAHPSKPACEPIQGDAVSSGPADEVSEGTWGIIKHATHTRGPSKLNSVQQGAQVCLNVMHTQCHIPKIGSARLQQRDEGLCSRSSSPAKKCNSRQNIVDRTRLQTSRIWHMSGRSTTRQQT